MNTRCVLTLLILIMFAPCASAADLSPELQATIATSQPDSSVTVWIRFRDTQSPAMLKSTIVAQGATRADRNRLAIARLKEATSTQQGVLDELAELRSTDRNVRYKSHWIVNVVEAELPINQLARVTGRPEVEAVYLRPTISAIEPIGYDATSFSPADITGVQSNLTHINAPAAWAAGYTGAGRIVCSFDTGVLGSHPALVNNWNGRNADSAASWFDPLKQINYPHIFDEAGNRKSHGTHVTGIMCGVDAASGDTVGVAPGAKWIAAGVIDIAGASVLDAFEWACDPDGDPNTVADVPDVINHSWGYQNVSCFPIFYDAIDATEACGIVNIIAAGNSGAAPQSVLNPADRALDSIDCIAVGNLNHRTDTLVPSSSRGPSPCNLLIAKPNVVAPGDSIISCWSDGSYRSSGGTSMAAPHVAGLVALLRQKNPNATVDEIKTVILNTTKRTGFGTIPNNNYGWGEINCLAAVNALTGPTTQSIRVADFRHDAISPGDTVEGTILLRNLGTQATSVTMSITGSNSALTVLDGSLTFGTIGLRDTVRSADSIRVVVSDTVTPGSILPIDVTVSGNGFNTPGRIYFLVEPPQVKAFTTHDVDGSRIRFSVSNFGAYGLGPNQFSSIFPLGGVGFDFDGNGNELYEGGIMVGNFATRVSSAVHSFLFDPDIDFQVAPGGNIQKYDPGTAAAQETYSAYIDANARTPLGLKITQRTYAFNPPNDDFIIMSYVVRNVSGSTVSNLYFGLFLDWDIVNYNSNCGGNEPADGFAWIAYNNGVTKSDYRGIKLIGATPYTAGAARSDSIYPPVSLNPGPGFPTDEKYRILRSGTLYADINKNAQEDLFLIVSSGPFALASGAEDTIAFAILAGETFADIQDAAARANFNPTDVDDDEPDNLPGRFTLYQNYPNPFNPSTTISFELPSRSEYTLEVINILGQTVYEYRGLAVAGRVELQWDASDHASGVYLYRVTAGDYSAARKMLLLK